MLASDAADVTCCGQTLQPLTPQTPDAAHRLTAELSDGEWYLTSDHSMRREYYLSFAALVNEDTVVLRRLYPSGARRRACRTLRTARCCGTARSTACSRSRSTRAKREKRTAKAPPERGAFAAVFR
ncbi:MAG: hypothetical protein ACLTG4_12070 [Oscillospiraceae bacterium]